MSNGTGNDTPMKVTKERALALRAELAKRDVDGFVVPHADEYQNEYVPRRAERLAWLTGFTGSAGAAVVLREKGAIFIDGRYTLQVERQTDLSVLEHHHLTDSPPDKWIAANLPAGAKLAYDPWLHTVDDVAKLRTACESASGTLVAIDGDPIDAIWTDQPEPPLAPAVPYAIQYAGRTSAEKRAELVTDLVTRKVDAVVITATDSLAWLLNIRGGDVDHTPLVLAYAILHADASVDVFIDPRKVTFELPAHLGADVRLHPPDAFGSRLEELGGAGKKVQADPASAPSWVFDRLAAANATAVRATDPCALPKACKNPVELAGMRAAHERDGAALTRFLYWIAQNAVHREVTELEAQDRLAGFRREVELFKDESFSTISGAGPNGAIVHYRSSPATNRRLEPGSLYLVDSGGQYLDGTTDVTRTVAIGTPSDEQRDRFTRVLQGHISVGRSRFPAGTTGSQLDSFARRALWDVGLDYDHGTGHGVGCYLGVHEGPHRISKVPNTVALKPGMIVSNEPGYYKTGEYGIRIESLVLVVASETVERDMLAFETLTMAPIDRALVDVRLLSTAEIDWLDAYHARVREVLTPILDAETAAWLAEATAPLA